MKREENTNEKDKLNEKHVIIEMTLFTAVMSIAALLVGFIGMLYFIYKIIQI